MGIYKGSNRDDNFAGSYGADTLRGQRGNDLLFGDPQENPAAGGNDLIWGGAGSDGLYGGMGDDVCRGGDGNDSVCGQDGNDQLWGGFGNDGVYTGLGADLAVGGRGNDYVQGSGDLFGDEGPGRAYAGPGNDRLATQMRDDPYQGTTHTGGDGADVFEVWTYTDGVASTVWVTDFEPGADKLMLGINYGDVALLLPETVRAVLDTNGNGLLGDDAPLDGNSEVYSDVAGNQLVIRLHEDHVVLQGVTSLAAGDWLLA